MTKRFDMTCPLPLGPDDRVMMAHGGGGRKTQELVYKLFGAAFDDPVLHRFDDAAVVPGAKRLAMTTDSYVVSPLEFPGGDIGCLAVYGTVNDLAMVGARPMYLTFGVVLEEGLPLETLWRITRSAAAAALETGVRIVAGDTKVVERGHADGLYINTAGVGFIAEGLTLGASQCREGDAVLLSGDLGRHGIAVLAHREGLGFETTIESDCAPLHEVALALLEANIAVRCMRDLTRGGLASALVELSESANIQIELDEGTIAVCDAVEGACEILGLDPLHVANEGRFVAIVAPADAARAVEIMRSFEVAAEAVVIGEVGPEGPARVAMKTALGSRRWVDMFSGEQLPRIC